MSKHKKLLLLLLIILLTTSYFLSYTPVLFSIIIFLSSLLAYFAYAKDKAAAMNDDWRVPEKTLHLLSLFFGWPGAMIAQERLRHKTKKLSFRVVFWMTVSANVSVIYAIHTPEGAEFLSNSISRAESVMASHIRSHAVHDIVLSLIELRS